jgi:hypothetical protein
MRLAGRAGARKHEMSPSERGTSRNRDRVEKRRTLWCRPPGTRRSTADGSSVGCELKSRKRTHHNKDWLVARVFSRRASKSMERSQHRTGPTFISRQDARNEAIIGRIGTTAWMTSLPSCASTGIETARTNPTPGRLDQREAFVCPRGRNRANEPKREVGQGFVRHFTPTVGRNRANEPKTMRIELVVGVVSPGSRMIGTKPSLRVNHFGSWARIGEWHRGSYMSRLQSKHEIALD